MLLKEKSHPGPSPGRAPKGVFWWTWGRSELQLPWIRPIWRKRAPRSARMGSREQIQMEVWPHWGQFGILMLETSVISRHEYLEVGERYLVHGS